MTIKFQLPALFCLLLLMSNCGGESCRNSNKILATYGAEDALYKIELGKLYKDGTLQSSHYYFEDLRESYGDTILVSKLKGEKLCAIIQAKIKSWHGLEEIKKTLGHDMKGRELLQLKIRMSDSLTIPIFYCDGAAGIAK